MSDLKITKFGIIHKDVSGDRILLSDFELSGDYEGDTYIAIIDAIMSEFELSRAERVKEIEG